MAVVFFFQMKQVGNGAHELNHVAADFSGKSLDLRKHDASPRWQMTELKEEGKGEVSHKETLQIQVNWRRLIPFVL